VEVGMSETVVDFVYVHTAQRDYRLMALGNSKAMRVMYENWKTQVEVGVLMALSSRCRIQLPYRYRSVLMTLSLT
jgi:hypothetical protein